MYAFVNLSLPLKSVFLHISTVAKRSFSASCFAENKNIVIFATRF
jgi:hypothetical protein